MPSSRRDALAGVWAAIAAVHEEVELLKQSRPKWLRCEECDHVASDDTHGWRAYLTEEEGGSRVAVFCPGCAEARFVS